MKKKSLLIGMAALMLPLGMQAQYTIYPVPHEQTAGTGKVAFTQTVNVICDNGIDSYTKKRVTDVFAAHGVTVNFSDAPSTTESNVYLGINGANGKGNEVATAQSLSLDVLTKEGKFDRHILSLTDAGNGVAQLLVLGENTDATFMGLASLEQILDNGTADLQTVTINDYADLKERGIIEGFYGKPYSGEVRKDLLRFMMRYKMNCYVYGPKSDPYHSGNGTYAPYPTELTETQKASGFVTQQDLKSFTDVAHETKVSVVWAIHPGNAFIDNDDTNTKIMGKFEAMYNLGFRQFAVFVDDVDIPSNKSGMDLTASRVTDLQHRIESKWNTPGTDPADTVKALRFTPQIYCRSFAGPDDQFNNFFQSMSSLPANVTVYYTGGAVWSVPNNDDLNLVQNQFGRNVIWWWNYPCNDNGTGPSEIYPLDMKSNFVDMPNVSDNATIASELTASNQGILCNPMEQGSASRTPVFSAGDYSWNNKAFNNTQSWEASFKALFPGEEKFQKAYRFLAPYLSKNDPASLNTLIENYKTSKNGEALSALMGEIITHCNTMTEMEHSTNVSDSLLYVDIKPWILRLRGMATATQKMLAASNSEDIETVWKTYRPGMTEAEKVNTAGEYMTKHMSGFGADKIDTEDRLTHASYRYLTPFVTEYLKMHALDGKFQSAATTPQVFTNVEGLTATINNNADYYSMSGTVKLPEGGYVGMELPAPEAISSITLASKIIPGTGYVCLISEDGKSWTRLEAKTTTPTTPVRYFAILNNTGAAVSYRLVDTTVKIYKEETPAVRNAYAPTTNFWSGHTANLMADGNYATYTCINQSQAVGDTYSIELDKSTDVKSVRICMGTRNGDYPAKATVSVSADNLIWTPLRVTGTNVLNYSMDLPQNVKVSTAEDDGSDVMALDFNPINTDYEPTTIRAKYIRFKVTAIPSGDKWLRLHEIEVNGKAAAITKLQSDKGYYLKEATDNNPSTSTSNYQLSTAEGGQFTYSFYSTADAKALTLLCDGVSMQAATYSVTTDGENWTDIEPVINDDVVKIDLTSVKGVKAVRIYWAGRIMPKIYEVIESLDEATKAPVLTRIESVEAGSQDADLSVNVEAGSIVAKSAIGLRAVSAYTADGRQVLSQSLSGSQSAVLPIVGASQQTIIVKVTLTNGKTQSYKLSGK